MTPQEAYAEAEAAIEFYIKKHEEARNAPQNSSVRRNTPSTSLDLSGNDPNKAKFYHRSPLRVIPRSILKTNTITHLNISHTDISDLSILDELDANLTSLDLHDTLITDINPIAQHPSITTLDLEGTQIRDLRPLKVLENLKALDVSNTQAQDLTPIASLQKLENLYALSLTAQDIQPLSKLSRLSNLSLSCRDVRDYFPIQDLTNLTHLKLYNFRSRTLDFLSSLNQLSMLHVEGAVLDDISALQNTFRLKQLSLKAPRLKILPDLSNLKSLTGLTIEKSNVHNLAPISDFTQLVSLSVNNSPVTDLQPLSKLTNLTVINLNQTEVRDLSPLSALQKLSKISLQNTPITDLSPLATLSNLKDLDIQKSNVSSLAPLANVKWLHTLNFSDTKVYDLRPIYMFYKEPWGYTACILKFASTPASQLDPETDRIFKKSVKRIHPRDGFLVGYDEFGEYLANMDDQIYDRFLRDRSAELNIPLEPADDAALHWRQAHDANKHAYHQIKDACERAEQSFNRRYNSEIYGTVLQLRLDLDENFFHRNEPAIGETGERLMSLFEKAASKYMPAQQRDALQRLVDTLKGQLEHLPDYVESKKRPKPVDRGTNRRKRKGAYKPVSERPYVQPIESVEQKFVRYALAFAKGLVRTILTLIATVIVGLLLGVVMIATGLPKVVGAVFIVVALIILVSRARR